MDRVKQNKGILEYWGFRKKGFSKSLRIVLPVSIVLIFGFTLYGLIQNTLIFNRHLLPVLLLYPIWGIIQQFLIIGLIAGNLFDMHGNKLSDFWVVIITSTVFAVVHYPNIQLVVATFCLAVGYTLLYRRYRNLWVPGIFHGILGAFFYFFVLGDDQWEKVFGSF